MFVLLNKICSQEQILLSKTNKRNLLLCRVRFGPPQFTFKRFPRKKCSKTHMFRKWSKFREGKRTTKICSTRSFRAVSAQFFAVFRSFFAVLKLRKTRRAKRKAWR